MKLTSRAPGFYRRWGKSEAFRLLYEAERQQWRQERTRFLATAPLNRAKWTAEQVARWRELNP